MTRIPVMAIDPSLRATGVALGHVQGGQVTVDSIHLIETEKTKHKQTRKNSDDLRCAREVLDAVRRHHQEHAPLVTFVEVPQGAQSARASWALGIMLGLIASLPLPVVELTPTEVKQGFAGSKTASKETMLEHATSLHPDLAWLTRGGKPLNKNEHMADAVAILHVGATTTAFRELARMLDRMVPL